MVLPHPSHLRAIALHQPFGDHPHIALSDHFGSRAPWPATRLPLDDAAGESRAPRTQPDRQPTRRSRHLYRPVPRRPYASKPLEFRRQMPRVVSRARRNLPGWGRRTRSKRIRGSRTSSTKPIISIASDSRKECRGGGSDPTITSLARGSSLRIRGKTSCKNH